MEVHGAPISKEDINQKFLRSLPSSWNQIALIMRNKPDIDEIDIDDLYNNLRVYGSTNEVSTASGDFGVSTAGGINQVPSTPCAHDMDGDDLEELDLRWQVAMLTVRVKKSGRNQGRRSYGDNGRSNAPTTESSSQALVAQDGLGGYDWSNDFEVEPVNYALMAIFSSSSSSSSDSEVQKCSKQCLESFKTLQKNYDTEREKHNKAKLEIKGYEIALESLESRILRHEKNELAWGEKYEFQNYELKCREIKINNLNLELEKVVKERDELKDKIAKWEESTKNLDEILNSQMSARDKTGLRYGTQLNELISNHETNRLDKYAIRNKIIESQTTKLNTKTSETAGQTNDENTEKPKSASELVMSNPKIDRDRVIIKDWNSDDEEEMNEVQTVRPETQIVKTRDDKSGQNSQKQGISFRKVKACFVYKSTEHLIKDCLSRPNKGNYLDHVSKDSGSFMLKKGNLEILLQLQDHVVVDSGCSSHMTGNKAYLLDYEDLNGGFVAFRSDPKGGKITGKGKIKTANLDSVSQMCDKKNSVIFTKSECLILSPSFKLLDESQVVLRAPRKDDVYSLDLKNMVPSGGTLLENVDLEGIKGEDLMVTITGSNAQNKMNLLHITGLAQVG
ncbi:hypothetical protein Tco_1036583 [Tanacetum coccineum]